MTSDGTSAFSPKGQGIMNFPTKRKTAHHSTSQPTKAPKQRNPDVEVTADASAPLRTASSSPVNHTSQPEKNPVKAYLRIRPLPSTQKQSSFSYLKILDDQHVSFMPPEDTNAYRKRQGASDQYQFTKVFTDNTHQQQFFEETTLPLLQTFIHGNNALIFAYGVTNSGKTYSMLGNTLDAGIVPRTIHILFTNLQDRLSQARLKPVMHSTIQSYDLNHASEVDDEHENRSLLLDVLDSPHYDIPNDNEKVLTVDKRFEYGIWLSFAEIYNEKVYDLLASPDHKKRTKRSALPLKYEYRSGYKYVAGLKHVRVKSAKEAYTVIHIGQQNRVVFSTLMNQSSSRSHSVFTISLVRCPIDKEDYVVEDPAYATLSKMSIVDLAGSERYRNTFNQGQRLKEAGNINKSLMVLGQCMETLRMNQIKIESGKRPGMVPYRQSKLTELFKNTFEGDGQVAIVVNVNPFDTGFDENSHVMKFAAIAKEVTTIQQQKKSTLHDISDTVNKRQRRDTADSGSDSESLINNFARNQHHDITAVNRLLEELECVRSKWLESAGRRSSMESDLRRQIDLEKKQELENIEERHKSLSSLQKHVTESRVDVVLEALETADDNEETLRSALLLLKEERQKICLELDRYRSLLNGNEEQKLLLMDTIASLQNDRVQDQFEMVRLQCDILQLKAVINNYRNNSSLLPTLPSWMTSDGESILPTQSIHSHQQLGLGGIVTENGKTTDGDDRQYAIFLELRKQLRRSVFKREELLEDAESILHEIEQFENVTFDLVKNTKMGKLLKLITQEEFKSDPYLIQQRALVLFKRFARLPRSTPSQQQQQHQRTSFASPENSIEYHSSIDDFDLGHHEADGEGALMDDFGDDNDFNDDNDGGNENGNAKASQTELLLNIEKNADSLGKGAAYDPMTTGDGIDDPLSLSAHDVPAPARKRRRKLRIRG